MRASLSRRNQRSSRCISEVYLHHRWAAHVRLSLGNQRAQAALIIRRMPYHRHGGTCGERERKEGTEELFQEELFTFLGGRERLDSFGPGSRDRPLADGGWGVVPGGRAAGQ